MKKLTSRQRVLLGCAAMALAIVGDYLLGYGTIGTSSAPDAYLAADVPGVRRDAGRERGEADHIALIQTK